MEEKIKAELEELIPKGEFLTNSIQSDWGAYFCSQHQEMHDWIASSESIIKFYFDPNYNKLEFTKFSLKDDHAKLLARLRSELNLLLKIPNYISNKKENNNNKKVSSITINNTQNQSQKQEQSQTQKIIQEVFLEAIKDELTGKQQKEIKAILKEHQSNIEEAKPKLIEKLTDFGTNVLANVVSNIITNPLINGLF